jgi:hypothetical protein
LTHVTVYYKLYLTSGHHRQPRNTSSTMDLAAPSGGDEIPGTSYSPTLFPTLPWTGGNATLEFWSVTDGSSGQVFPPTTLTQTVGLSPLTITAWYFPTGGDGNGGGYEIIDDAFSANLGGFIDDTFVDVTSDPTLTNGANVDGIVPTDDAETLKASLNVVSTPEPFHVWVMNGVFGTVGNQTLNVPQHTEGMAVAIYQSPPPPPPRIPPNVLLYNPWWWIESWWGHGPDPGPEWTRQLSVIGELIGLANQVSPQLKSRVLEIALQQMKLSTSNLENQIKGLQQGN